MPVDSEAPFRASRFRVEGFEKPTRKHKHKHASPGLRRAEKEKRIVTFGLRVEEAGTVWVCQGQPLGLIRSQASGRPPWSRPLNTSLVPFVDGADSGDGPEVTGSAVGALLAQTPRHTR